MSRHGLRCAVRTLHGYTGWNEPRSRLRLLYKWAPRLGIQKDGFDTLLAALKFGISLTH